MQMLKMKMTQDITKQILDNEQTCSCKWMFFWLKYLSLDIFLGLAL
jgi:hypothetical protein